MTNLESKKEDYENNSEYEQKKNEGEDDREIEEMNHTVDTEYSIKIYRVYFRY